MVMFKKEKEEVIHLQAHFKKNQKIREYSSHISKVHSVDWSADGSKLNQPLSYSINIKACFYEFKILTCKFTQNNILLVVSHY